MKMQRLGSALVPMVLLMACGGDGDGKSGTVDLGVDDSKVIGDLTSAEAIQICENLQNQQGAFDVELSKEQSCTVGSALFASDPAQCKTLRDQCIKAPDSGETPDDGEDDDGDCSEDDPTEREGCKATIGEMEACLNATIRQFDKLTELTCDDAGESAQQQANAQPDECKSLYEKCPGLNDDDESAEGGSMTSGHVRKLRRALAR